MRGSGEELALRTALVELTGVVGALCPSIGEGRRTREFERLFAQALRVTACVERGLAGGVAADAGFEEGRGAAAALAARVHLALHDGLLGREAGLEIRRRIRAVVDAIDRARLRLRRAG
ncbi:MAG: hypothetical protein IT452_07665 [Planctomycetia bacterium]|nr:hypothetical protein [Planctomycetia bacterium]